jgi:hypothetical protein
VTNSGQIASGLLTYVLSAQGHPAPAAGASTGWNRDRGMM